MSTPITKKKSAMDDLLDSFGQVIDSGAEKMDSAKLRESEERFNEIADRAAFTNSGSASMPAPTNS